MPDSTDAPLNATIHFISASPFVSQTATQLSTTFTVAAGNSIVVEAWAWLFGATVTLDGATIADSAGTSYTSVLAATTVNNCGGGSGAVAVKAAFNVIAGVHTITITPTNSGGGTGMEI